jgi:hypothetical protein
MVFSALGVIVLPGGILSNFMSFDKTEITNGLSFTVLFVHRRNPALPHRNILLIQQSQDLIGSRLLDNYQTALKLP